LRSIEQNELAIIADNKNKAIFVFTGVTIIFLPLSFFTSYFGMNIGGIVDTDKTERYFWEVCGTVSFVIILIFGVFAMRYRLKELYRAFKVQRNTSMV
jgi:Mg2+ and Co2+ transporter CorA